MRKRDKRLSSNVPENPELTKASIREIKLPPGTQRDLLCRAAELILSNVITDRDGYTHGFDQNAGKYMARCLRRLDILEKRNPTALRSFEDIEPPIIRAIDDLAADSAGLAYDRAPLLLAFEHTIEEPPLI